MFFCKQFFLKSRNSWHHEKYPCFKPKTVAADTGCYHDAYPNSMHKKWTISKTAKPDELWLEQPVPTAHHIQNNPAVALSPCFLLHTLFRLSDSGRRVREHHSGWPKQEEGAFFLATGPLHFPAHRGTLLPRKGTAAPGTRAADAGRGIQDPREPPSTWLSQQDLHSQLGSEAGWGAHRAAEESSLPSCVRPETIHSSAAPAAPGSVLHPGHLLPPVQKDHRDLIRKWFWLKMCPLQNFGLFWGAVCIKG